MLMEISKAYDLVVGKLESWLNTAISMLPNLVIALLVLIVFYVVSKALRQFVEKLLGKVTENLTIIHLIGSVVSITIAGIGLFISLSVLQLDDTVKTLLAGAGIIGLALGFAFQDIASNFIAGVILSLRHPFGVNDWIKAGDYYGKVDRLNLRNTILETPQGQVVYLPNKNVFESALVNFSKKKSRRIDLSVGVSYGDDLEKVKKITIDAIGKIKNLTPGKDIKLYYQEFGDSSINFSVQFWVPFKNQTDFLEPQSQAIMLIKKAYNENDITIPFPIRTLDFGIKGGEKLSTMIGNTTLNNQDGES